MSWGQSIHEQYGERLGTDEVDKILRDKYSPETQNRNLESLMKFKKTLDQQEGVYAHRIGWKEGRRNNDKYILGLSETAKRCVESFFYQPKTGGSRSLEQVANMVNLSSEQLVKDLGKKILDVGPGGSSFEREVLGMDDSVNILSVDMSLSMLQVRTELDHRVVINDRNLPFEDGSFSGVLASFSIPMYEFNPDQIGTVIDELLRVIDKDGRLIIHPICSNWDTVTNVIARTPSLIRNDLRGDYNNLAERWSLQACLVDKAVLEKILSLIDLGKFEVILDRSIKGEENMTDLSWEISRPDILIVKKL